MSQSRAEYVKKNIIFSYTSNIITAFFQIICRTVFIYTLGAEFLGVSGLFTNVLGILSFSELGIGQAINYSLYKPIADNDKEKIKSLLHLYKLTYRAIAVIITLLGLLLFPFLKYLVNTDIPMSDINIFYFIFLFNMVSSYFVTYKTSYVTALQKNYIVTSTVTAGTIITNVLQIILLCMGGSYLQYLLIASIIGLVQKVATVMYLNKRFPILNERATQPIDTVTKAKIKENVSAQIFHKFGEAAVYQTDNIIVSTFINTATVGIISNYTTLNQLVAMFTNGIFNSFSASFGNLIVKESKIKQRDIYEAYDFLAFWVFSFVAVAFITLSQPFITLWLGKENLIDNLTMVLFFTSVYLANMTLPLENFKVAAGKFKEDKWVAFGQATINLVVSIIAVKKIGLPGVYVGTIVQRILVIIIRPYVVYHYVLDEKVSKYYIMFFKRLILTSILCSVMWLIKTAVLQNTTLYKFVILMFLTALVPNAIYFVLFKDNKEFTYIISKIKMRKR